MPYILNKPPLTMGNITYEIKDGIVFIKRHMRVSYSVEELKAHVMKRIEYTEGVSYPVILFGQDMVSMDKSARDYLAGDGAKNALSRAFVVDKLQAKLQLNFFIETNKQPVPTRVFEDMEEAIEWSKQYRHGD